MVPDDDEDEEDVDDDEDEEETAAEDFAGLAGLLDLGNGCRYFSQMMICGVRPSFLSK